MAAILKIDVDAKAGVAKVQAFGKTVSKTFQSVAWSASQTKIPLDKVRDGLTSIGKAGAIVVAGLTAVGAAIGATAKRASNFDEAMGDMAAAFGTTAQETSKLIFMQKKFGGETAQLEVAMKGLTNKMRQANMGNKEAIKLFDGLNVSLKNTDGTSRGAVEVMKDISEEFSKMPDGIQKSSFAIQAFEESGAKMIPFLNQGRKEMERMGAMAEEFGAVASDASVKIATEFNHNLRILGQLISGTLLKAGRELIPVFNAITTEVTAMGRVFVSGINFQDMKTDMVAVTSTAFHMAAGFTHLTGILAEFVIAGARAAALLAAPVLGGLTLGSFITQGLAGLAGEVSHRVGAHKAGNFFEGWSDSFKDMTESIDNANLSMSEFAIKGTPQATDSIADLAVAAKGTAHRLDNVLLKSLETTRKAMAGAGGAASSAGSTSGPQVFRGGSGGGVAGAAMATGSAIETMGTKALKGAKKVEEAGRKIASAKKLMNPAGILAETTRMFGVGGLAAGRGGSFEATPTQTPVASAFGADILKGMPIARSPMVGAPPPEDDQFLLRQRTGFTKESAERFLKFSQPVERATTSTAPQVPTVRPQPSNPFTGFTGAAFNIGQFHSDLRDAVADGVISGFSAGRIMSGKGSHFEAQRFNEFLDRGGAAGAAGQRDAAKATTQAGLQRQAARVAAAQARVATAPLSRLGGAATKTSKVFKKVDEAVEDVATNVVNSADAIRAAGERLASIAQSMNHGGSRPGVVKGRTGEPRRFINERSRILTYNANAHLRNEMTKARNDVFRRINERKNAAARRRRVGG